MYSGPWLLVGCPALGGLDSASLQEEVQLQSLGTAVGVCPLPHFRFCSALSLWLGM